MIMTGGSEQRSFARRSGQWMTLSIAALAGAGLAGFVSYVFSSAAEAKTPGSTYCYYGTCHRVKTLAETESLIGTKEIVHASFYDDCKRDSLNPCGLTSSGEAFHPDRPDNAASPVYPDGTTLLVWSPNSKQAVVLRVNNAGPYWGKRKLDVSRAAAESLGFKPTGVAELQIKVLDAPSQAEATYARNRRYQAVPGPVGKYDSLEEARLSLAAMRAIDEMPTSVAVPVADAATALAEGIRHDAMKIDLPPQVKVASAEPLRLMAKPTTVQKRQEAKVKRVASKRKQTYARRGGAKRSSVASRRHARGSRYAMHRGAKSGRVARSRVMSRSRVATRHLRGRKPAITRTVKRSHRRVAEAQFDRFEVRQSLQGPRLLRDVPLESGGAQRSQRLKMPVRGPVQVV